MTDAPGKPQKPAGTRPPKDTAFTIILAVLLGIAVLAIAGMTIFRLTREQETLEEPGK